jgi:hypothetical protein
MLVVGVPYVVWKLVTSIAGEKQQPLPIVACARP